MNRKQIKGEGGRVIAKGNLDRPCQECVNEAAPKGQGVAT
jgi:hypothetical protein